MLDHYSNRLQATLLESNRLTLKPVTCELGPLLEEVVSLHQFAAREKRQSLTLDARGRFQAVVDPIRMREVLDQLVSNAIRFSPEGKPIVVRLFYQKGKARIQIEDKGQGLDWQEQEALFARRLNASHRPITQGGLGLSIAKKLVDLHGGHIWAYSPGPGKGATFCVEIDAHPLGA